MFKISRLSHAFLLILALTASSSLMSDSNRWSSAETIATGAAIGTANGILSRITDAAFPFNWLLLNEIQRLFSKAVINDAQRRGESVDAHLLNDSTWISSWISYLVALNSLSVRYVATPILFRVTIE